MVKEFSLELHRKEMEGDYDAVALSTLRKLKEKVAMRENLFAEQDKIKFERLVEMYPNEYGLIENKDAFDNLSQEQQREILFEQINKRPRPANPVLHELED